MNKTLDVFEQAFAAHPVGVLLGIALILLRMGTGNKWMA